MIAVVRCFSVYKVPITLLYGTRAEINRWLKRRDMDPLNEDAAGNYRIYPSGNGQSGFISLVKGNGAIPEICALLHEVVHCAVYTFAKVGIPIRDLEEEPFCYFVESIMHQCLTGIKKART